MNPPPPAAAAAAAAAATLPSPAAFMNVLPACCFGSSSGPTKGLAETSKGLFVTSSLTSDRKKIEFLPNHHHVVNWYGCGPTVYDWPHIGHARTYVSFDILRRIMMGYFGYKVNMVMNITDVDDKIITRAKEQNKDFMEVARHWEKVFWEDMQALNVMEPDVKTRVTEYMPEIIQYIDGIIQNGFAYESNSSVYFDTQTFQSAEQHTYGRMEPNALNDRNRVLEGEGSLGIAGPSDKKCVCDFALWKKAKDGEPFWESPWGKGRPGWHIECSAMASCILPFPLDIHSGGVDLRFPHHENELAQSEAYYNKAPWVKYFLHTGHLNIHGAKMSKSLKNFITIRQILDEFSGRRIRILFLLNRWDSPMNYCPSGDSMKQAVAIDSAFDNFFATIRTLRKKLAGTILPNNRDVDKDLLNQLTTTKQKIDEFMKDN